jgi:Zn-dependent protease with chaperone function
MRLFLASLFTIILLSGFLIAIFLSLLYFAGIIEIYFTIGLTIIINFILWLLGPKISDFIYGFFYKVRWIDIDDLKKISQASADIILRVCKKYNFKIPKLGIIPDKNPNAFTYGSGRWNSRIIVTEGIFTYLDEKERASVFAHELGHIKNRDFIIMTIASTLLQILYELYVISKRLSDRNGNRRKSSGAFSIIMIISYIFFWIGRYVVLYLSRIREYYADEFSAKETDPNFLSSALIKISYGILVNPDDVRLINSTQFIGITDFKLSKNIGMVYYNCANLKDFKPLQKALIFDIKNPWAFIMELNSTHPLTGKRLKRLSQMSNRPLFNFNKIEKEMNIDNKKLYLNFLKDVFVVLLPSFIIIIFPILFILMYSTFSFVSIALFSSFWLFLIGLSILFTTIYKYPNKIPENSNVLELMSDIYASPVRGKPVKLSGKLIGKGIPGLIFSEDMMMQDRTGLIFLNYESWLPIIGNLFFGLKKVPKLINKDAEITGWFLRGMYPIIGLNTLKTKEEMIRGFVKLGGIIIGFGLIILSLLLFFVLYFLI